MNEGIEVNKLSKAETVSMVTHEGTRCSFTLVLQILIASNNVARESLFGNFLTDFISLKLELHYNSLYNICYL